MNSCYVGRCTYMCIGISFSKEMVDSMHQILKGKITLNKGNIVVYG